MVNTPIGSRLSNDDYFIQMAILVAKRGTCARRQVGAVLTNAVGHVIATGYNGVHRGARHCIDHRCPGAEYPSGEGLHQCQAIHAEENALMQCHDILQIHSLYVTASPCLQCVRKLMNTSVKRIVFATPYSHPDAQQVAESCGVLWIHHKVAK